MNEKDAASDADGSPSEDALRGDATAEAAPGPQVRAETVKPHAPRLAAARKIASALRHPSLVVEGLYIGSYGAAEDRAELASCGITHLVSLVNQVPQASRDLPALVFDVSDSGETDLAALVRASRGFLETASRLGGSVLVFCTLGVNRSPAFTTAYLRITQGWPVAEALERVQVARATVDIHERYLEQLDRL